MLKLSTKQIEIIGAAASGIYVCRVTTNPALPAPLRRKHILLLNEPTAELPIGFAGICCLSANKTGFLPDLSCNTAAVHILPDDQSYLSDGDIVVFEPSKPWLHTLYRRSSKHNSLLVTERCNNFCLMCSQPPKAANDDYVIEHLMEAIPLMDQQTEEVGITGGEPTLLGTKFIELLQTIKHCLPRTSLHVLSNGRKFCDESFAAAVASIRHPDLMIGIPVYSDLSHIHDYVVQADGAFDQTIRGILNLKRYHQKVEVRVVIHKQTYARLPQLANFIARNLRFVDHVALMGLEMMGFTKFNLEDLWIDPVDYQTELVTAAETLDRYRVPVSVYNHQLCLLDKRLYPFNRKSISDWKNEYMPECDPCVRKSECGGFFASAKLRYSNNITPFKE
jgi:His-Xaa-Ser system radical SAM maturase HxsC